MVHVGQITNRYLHLTSEREKKREDKLGGENEKRNRTFFRLVASELRNLQKRKNKCTARLQYEGLQQRTGYGIQSTVPGIPPESGRRRFRFVPSGFMTKIPPPL